MRFQEKKGQTCIYIICFASEYIFLNKMQKASLTLLCVHFHSIMHHTCTVFPKNNKM